MSENLAARVAAAFDVAAREMAAAARTEGAAAERVAEEAAAAAADARRAREIAHDKEVVAAAAAASAAAAATRAATFERARVAMGVRLRLSAAQAVGAGTHLLHWRRRQERTCLRGLQAAALGMATPSAAVADTRDVLASQADAQRVLVQHLDAAF